MVDYYEFLQISPNADMDTIHRVYRFLATRLHPDNPTGDQEKFQLLQMAYDILSDRSRRAEYDMKRKLHAPQPLSETVDFMDSLEGELNRRLAVLAVLYQRRRTNAMKPEVSLADIEERMGFPRDYLDFTLWYVQKKGYVTKTDGAQYTLTADGVDFVEQHRVGMPSLNRMLLTSGSQEARAAGQDGPMREPAALAEGQETWASAGTAVPAADPTSDRRRGQRDRRAGAPDTRTFKTERRVRPRDRRKPA
jgi:curved DNA-binding protein CbpA